VREIVTLVTLHGSIGCRMLSAVVYDQQKKVGGGGGVETTKDLGLLSMGMYIQHPKII
jgi:hypothetical protein